MVFNNTTNFNLSPGTPAKFIFATEDGTLSAWSSGTDAVLMVDHSAAGAIYKGLALGSAGGSNYLYATDFHNGRVDVFDGGFNPVIRPGAFTDFNLPAGFAPFGIAVFGTNVFVTYALQDANAADDVPGPGNGFVDIYDTGGNWIKRFASNGVLDSPWGMTLAPASFGLYANQLLIGNFGDGTINAFDPASGLLAGTLQDAGAAPVSIAGLWDLKFGNGGGAGATNTLYFTAGIAGGGAVEDHGLFGGISVAATATATATAQVSVVNNQFVPATTNIQVGDRVIWTWPGGAFNHNVTSTSAPQAWPASPTKSGPYTFTNTFTSAGNFPYECTIHAGLGMVGNIAVTAPQTPPAVAIFSPASGAVLAAPASLTLRATAGDSDGSVTNVRFLAGATVLASQTSAPFSAAVASLVAGNYTFSAVATDNAGLSATNSVNISVVTPVATALGSAALRSPGSFQLSYSVNPGLTYVVQRSTNLAAGSWISLVTNTAASNPVVFVDVHATNNPAFYRVRRQPNP
jgi:uncharacterized protein (TIGR03118 family)